MTTKIVILGILTTMFISCTPKITKSNDKLTDTIHSNLLGQGQTLKLSFEKGIKHNHPSFVFWVEDENGNYIQTLYVTKSVGTGVFQHGSTASGKWEPFEKRYPALLPYWAHKRNIKAEDGLFVPSTSTPIPDTYTGATPQHHFTLQTKLDKPVAGTIFILMEINQTWDWNEYWTNNKYPEDTNYKTSSQPALVYKAVINIDTPAEIELKPIGHSHYSGKDGSLNTDLSTLTTALKIVEKVTVKILP